MSDYIRREAALEAFENADADVYEDYGDGTVDWGFGRKNIQNVINGIPAADVAEVVHAQWEEADWREYDAQSCETIRYPKAAIVCTNCRCAFKKEALWTRNFCPNCGVNMDGGFDDATS